LIVKRFFWTVLRIPECAAYQNSSDLDRDRDSDDVRTKAMPLSRNLKRIRRKCSRAMDYSRHLQQRIVLTLALLAFGPTQVDVFPFNPSEIGD
jgi:hypothetical protein